MGVKDTFQGAFSENWKGIVRARVAFFGGISTLILLSAIVGYCRGEVSRSAVLSMLLFVAPNLLVSKIANHTQNPIRIENFRLLLNSATLPFVYAYADGNFSPFWLPYCFMCLSSPTTTYLSTENEKLCYWQIAYWLAHFSLFSWVENKFADLYSFSVALALMAIPSFFIVHLMKILRQTLLKERAKGDELAHAQAKLAMAGRLSALGEMAGGVAHEINTPLATIRLLMEQLQELMEEGNTDHAHLRQLGSTAIKMVDRISNIVKSLRTFARDSSDDPIRAVKINDLLAGAFNLCHERFINHGISFSVENPTANLSFDGRIIEISQVLLNLLNNACDAIRNLDKREMKWVRVEAKEIDCYIEIRVSNGGPRIDKETQKKLFQPFFTTKEIGKGVGLGLSVSLGIVKNHQGDLILDPLAPHTAFVIKLPKKQSSSPALVA